MPDRLWFQQKWVWRLMLPILVVAMLGSWWFFRCGPVTTVLLVRHADRDGEEDFLNAAGQARKRELLHVALKAGVTAILRSDANRAQQTAEPLADALAIAPVPFPGSDVQAFADEVRNHHAGGNVLIVGHSNTVPPIIAALGGPTLPNIAGDEFDNLFVLTLCSCRFRRVKLLNLEYGALSPPPSP